MIIKCAYPKTLQYQFFPTVELVSTKEIMQVRDNTTSKTRRKIRNQAILPEMERKKLPTTQEK